MCGCKRVRLTSLLFSFVIGVIGAILFFFSNLPTIYVGVWVALGIAILSVALMTILLAFRRCEDRKCLCKNGSAIIISVIGLIFSAVVALSRVLVPFSIVNSIIIFFNIFFFALLLILIILLFDCLTREEDRNT